MSQLAERMLIASSSVSGLVSRAIDRGLVERAASRVDGRVSELRLTPEGDRRLVRTIEDLGAPTSLLANLLQDAFPEVARRRRAQGGQRL